MPSTIRQLRVFLCHASQDKSIVRELQQQLADEGWIDPWLDEKKLHPGEDWRVSIEEAVESSDLVVICLSNNSVDKEGFVQKELRYAREIALEKPEGTIFLIPLRLEDCDVPRGLRFFQWADYFGEKKEQNYSELLDSFSIRRQQIVRREQERELRQAEEQEKIEKEERARREAEELATREAEELARRMALEIALKEEEERARNLILEKAKKDAFEKALEDAREKARLEAELYVQKEINEKKYKGSLTNFAPLKYLAVVSLLLIGLVFGISLVGLGQMGIGPLAKVATPTNLPSTNTPQPTDTPQPANTPTSTNTPILGTTPSPTTTPTPIINLEGPINNYLSNPTVTHTDWFDTLPDDNWSCASTNIPDGMLLINGSNSNCVRLKTFREGEGVLISFRLEEDSNFEFYFQDGLEQWNTNSYKRFGFATGPRNGTEASVWKGTSWIGARLQSTKPEIWYNLLLVMDEGPKFLLAVWEQDDPTKLIAYKGQFPQWSDVEWQLNILSFYGTVHFDNYAEISFSELK